MFAEACQSVWALSALRVAAEHGLIASLASGPRQGSALANGAGLHPVVVMRVLDVLVACGLLSREGDVFTLTEQGRAQASRGDALRADMAATFGQARALVEEARRGTLVPGWRHVDPEVIRSQAILSNHMTTRMLKPMAEVWPEVGVLLGREGSVLLDVGVGGAGASVAMCVAFPKLRVVGIDLLPAALIEARANVTRHGLGDRIELRAARSDELEEERAFDVAFVPGKFLDDRVFETTLAVLKKALKKDGCILTAGWRDPGEPRAAAISKLRNELWGSGPRTAAEVNRMLERAGFVDVRSGPPTGDIVPIVARV
jgi:hypothetical protein